MFNYNTSINKSTKIMPFHATFNYNPRVPLWSGVEHRFDKHLKNATGKDTSIPENLARLRALHHNTRQIVHHNLQHMADLKEEENRKVHPEAKWPSYKIHQRVWHYIDAKRETNWKFGPSWEKAVIVGIPSTAMYRIRREVGNKKVKTVNMQKLKPRHCGDGDSPPEEDKGEPGQDTKGRRIEEDSRGCRRKRRGRKEKSNPRRTTTTKQTTPRKSGRRRINRRRTRHRIGRRRTGDDRIGRQRR
jgi:hypothetical protein